jgi:hypothetical protein
MIVHNKKRKKDMWNVVLETPKLPILGEFDIVREKEVTLPTNMLPIRLKFNYLGYQITRNGEKFSSVFKNCQRSSIAIG